MSTRDISSYVKEMYAMDISATEISDITDKIIPAINEWRQRAMRQCNSFTLNLRIESKPSAALIDVRPKGGRTSIRAQ